MNGTTPCGAILERLQHEHHELNKSLVEMRLEFATLPTSTQPKATQTAIVSRLARLAATLRSHFAEEEEGGCYEEAVSRCPSLSPTVQALLAEHPQITLALEGLLNDIRVQRKSSEQLREEFDRFARKLKDHEIKENRLLQMALGGDASDYDVEGNE